MDTRYVMFVIVALGQSRIEDLEGAHKYARIIGLDSNQVQRTNQTDPNVGKRRKIQWPFIE